MPDLGDRRRSHVYTKTGLLEGLRPSELLLCVGRHLLRVLRHGRRLALNYRSTRGTLKCSCTGRRNWRDRSPHEISIIPHYAGVCNVLTDWVEAGRSLNACRPHVHIP